MDVPLVDCLLTVCVLLRCETYEALPEEVDFERVEAGHQGIDSQIVLEAINQVWIAHVLGHHVAWLALDFLFLADDFDTTTARGGRWLHDVHVLVVFGFTIHAEFSIIVGEKVRLGAKIEFGEDATHPTDVLPHHVLAANLE